MDWRLITKPIGEPWCMVVCQSRAEFCVQTLGAVIQKGFLELNGIDVYLKHHWYFKSRSSGW